jgi:hypothetical protein
MVSQLKPICCRRVYDPPLRLVECAGGLQICSAGHGRSVPVSAQCRESRNSRIRSDHMMGQHGANSRRIRPRESCSRWLGVVRKGAHQISALTSQVGTFRHSSVVRQRQTHFSKWFKRVTTNFRTPRPAQRKSGCNINF